MVRDFDPSRPVPPPVVEKLLDLAIRAPSAGFAQGWAFLVLSTPEECSRFWASARPPGGGPPDRWLTGMMRAPLIVVPHGSREAYLDRYAEPDKGQTDREPRWTVPYWYIDAGFASMLLLLGVVDAGLGACFFGIPRGSVATYRGTFGVPDTYTPIGALAVGYPAPDRRTPSPRHGRRPVTEVAHWGRWGASAP